MPKGRSSDQWYLTPEQARELQEQMRYRVVTTGDIGKVTRIAGIDVGFEKRNTIARAAVVVLRVSDLEVVDSAVARKKVTFPYIPGLLAFREIPVVLDALGMLRVRPQVLLCDGQGIAHPRRMGIASHLGLLTGIPSIGVAKSRLCGKHGAVPRKKGAWTPLKDGNEVIGAVLRTRVGTKPLFVSVGQKMNLESAIDLVMKCTTSYRLPETTRLAHKLASEKK